MLGVVDMKAWWEDLQEVTQDLPTRAGGFRAEKRTVHRGGGDQCPSPRLPQGEETED